MSEEKRGGEGREGGGRGRKLRWKKRKRMAKAGLLYYFKKNLLPPP